MAGLTKDTKYYYAIEIDGVLDLNFIVTFKTIKVNEPFSFSFIVSSCCLLLNNSVVFDSFRAEDPSFFLLQEIFFYANSVTNNLTLSTSKQPALYKNVTYYPLAEGAGEQPIYQSFKVGRVRFILSDLRSTIFIANKKDIVDMKNRKKVYRNPISRDQPLII